MPGVLLGRQGFTGLEFVAAVSGCCERQRNAGVTGCVSMLARTLGYTRELAGPRGIRAYGKVQVVPEPLAQ